MTFKTLNTPEYSWVIPQGLLQISMNQYGRIKATLSKQTCVIEIQRTDIKGIPEEVSKSTEVFIAFFDNFYPRLSQIGKHDYALYFEGRLLGGGGGGKSKSGDDGKGKSEGKAAVKHVAEHVAVEVAAKTVGASHVAAVAVAALLHTSALNENAPYPEGPSRFPTPPSEDKTKK